MKMSLRVFSVVAVLLGVSIPAMSQVLTPLPNIEPKPQLVMLWLKSLTLSPTTVAAGADVTGTITLARPAISNLVVGLGLSESTYIEGGILAADGAIMQASVTVPAGSDHATFKISTSKPNSTSGSKTFTVTGSYAKERGVSASFTTTQPLVKKTFP